MKWIKALGFAALAAGTLTFTACEERGNKFEDTTEQVGDDIRQGGQEMRDDVRDGTEDLRENDGTGGSGDVDIGERDGVIDDGEGPLENEETRPGDKPGVINDGEGPFENGHGPLENNQ